MEERRAFLILAAAALLPPLESGRVYVYAQRLTEAGSWLPVACGGSVVAELKQGYLFALNLPPGRHVLTAGDGVPLSVEIPAGQEVFVRLDWNYQVGRRPIPVFSAVPPEQARKQMVYLSYIPPKKALSRSVPATDPRDPAPPQLKTREASRQ
jgi:hypothetical protein